MFPVNDVPGTSPLNGLGTFAVSWSMVAWSRDGEVLRNCRGTQFSSRSAGEAVFFRQILKFVPRLEFEAAVKKHRAERHARGFRCCDRFVAMMFRQLGHAQSPREITGGLAACEGKVKHLGMNSAPHRSTLEYANNRRPWQLYETVFHTLLGRRQQEARGRQRKFRFKHKLLSIDGTRTAAAAAP